MKIKSALKDHVTPIKVFSILGIWGLFCVFFLFFSTNGELIDNYFFYDTLDTGMDFFHSIEYVNGRAPYLYFDTLYPPLANFLFYQCFLLVPISVSEVWPMDFQESILMRGTAADLRVQQVPLLLFCLFLVISIWMITSLMLHIMRDSERGWRHCAVFCMLFSPGMLYAVERGNILLLTLPFCLFFVAFRNSKSWLLRELALLSLAAAAGLKLYPVFLGVLILHDRKYFAAARAIVYGILSVVLPAQFFMEGQAGIRMWLKIVLSFGSMDTMPWIGTGFENILHHIALFLRENQSIEICTDCFSTAGIWVSGLLLFAALFLERDWQRILAATLAIVLFQTQARYAFSFFVIPMTMFLAEEKIFSIRNIVPFALLLLNLLNLPLFYIQDQEYPHIVLAQWVCTLLVIWCVTEFAAQTVSRICSARDGGKIYGNLAK